MRKSNSVSWISALLLVLAVGESALLWRVIRRPDSTQLVARLEQRLATQGDEINRLIIERDWEHRRLQSLVSKAIATAKGQSTPTAQSRTPVVIEKSAPSYDPNPSAGSTEEQELAEATLHTTNSRQSTQPIDPRQNAPIGPGDVDAGHLVNMANIMSGKDVAALKRINGRDVIQYQTTELSQDDPVFQMIDVLQDAHAIADVMVLDQRLAASLIASGVPANKVRLNKSSDKEFAGLDGIIIRLQGRLQGQRRGT